MTFNERRAALQALPDLEKQILTLARRISNSLIFANQNAHSERIQERYEQAAEIATTDLENLLLQSAQRQQL